MKTWFARMAVLAIALGSFTVLGVQAADDSAPDIETVMKKVNGGKSGLQKSLAGDLKASSVDWDSATKKSKEMFTLISALGKNSPPKGDKASWEKHCKEYTANAKALNEACEKKNKSGADAALGKLGRSCKSCHDAHKG